MLRPSQAPPCAVVRCISMLMARALLGQRRRSEQPYYFGAKGAIEKTLGRGDASGGRKVSGRGAVNGQQTMGHVADVAMT